MPGGITGLELLRRFTQEHPSVRTMLISGYSTEMAEGGVAASSVGRVLGKPFTPAVFLLAVGEKLAAASR
jgi:CheY-like chemotaxis protein